MNFMYGCLTGMFIFMVLTYIAPRHLRAVNDELVRAGLAHRDSITGECIWNDIKESQ